MKEITLYCGLACLVDDEDCAQLNTHRWHRMKSRGTFYAVRRPIIEGKMTVVYMHTELLKAPSGYIIDHIDGNGLNNQKQNLRLATSQQNSHNRSASSTSKTGFKGVNKQGKKWIARITYRNKTYYLGAYCSSIEAAKAYNTVALQYFGEFARLNVIK